MSASRRAASGPRRTLVVAVVSAVVLIPVAVTAACQSSPRCLAPDRASRGIGRELVALGPAGADSVPALVRMLQCRSCADPTPDPSVQPSASPSLGDARPVATPSPSQATPAPPAVPAPASTIRRPAVDPSMAASVRTIVVPTPRVHVVRVPVEVPVERVGAPGFPVPAAALAAIASALAIAVVLRRRSRTAFVARDPEAEFRRLTSTLLANLSHELYTPLTPVKGYVSILRNHDLDGARVHELAELMAGASDRLESTLESVVAYAEAESSRVDPHHDAVDVAELLRASIARSGARVDLKIDRPLPRVCLHARFIDIAVRALIDNAAKFSPKGASIRMTVRSSAGTGGRFLAIEVADRGIGMTPRQLRVAFEPFRQVDDATTRSYGGLGVGLSLARRVAGAHGGRLIATSRRGRGSIFTLSIPLVPADRPVPVRASA